MRVNKKVLIAVVVVIGILLLGFLYPKKDRDNLMVNSNTQKSDGVFDSIKDALTKDLTLQCEFSDENSSFKSYIKNGAVRVTTNSTNEGQVGEMIMKDSKMYIWDTKTKEGFVYDVPKNEDGKSGEVGMTGQEVVSSESYLDLIDKYKDSCKVATLEDSFFETPKDINFQDMSKFLEDLKQQMPSQMPQ